MRQIEDSHLRSILKSDFVWITAPDGKLGPSTAFEIGYAIAHGVPVYTSTNTSRNSKEPIIGMYAKPVRNIATLIKEFNPFDAYRVDPSIGRQLMYKVTGQTQPTSTNHAIAVGAMIVDHSRRRRRGQEHDILLVETYKWKGRFSIVGGKVKQGEKLDVALKREVSNQTNLACGIGDRVCAFDEFEGGGYYRPGNSRIFIDSVVKVNNRRVELNHEAQSHIWLPPSIALRDLDIEPNARKTVEDYAKNHVA